MSEINKNKEKEVREMIEQAVMGIDPEFMKSLEIIDRMDQPISCCENIILKTSYMGTNYAE